MAENSFENIVGKGENVGNQHFLLFQQYFQNIFYPVREKKAYLLPIYK